MIKRTRPSFECWQCERSFGQVVDLDGEPLLLLECPYCGAQCKVDMAPYRQRVIEVLRGKESDLGGVRYELPGKIATFKPGEQEPEQEG